MSRGCQPPGRSSNPCHVPQGPRGPRGPRGPPGEPARTVSPTAYEWVLEDGLLRSSLVLFGVMYLLTSGVVTNRPPTPTTEYEYALLYPIGVVTTDNVPYHSIDDLYTDPNTGDSIAGFDRSLFNTTVIQGFGPRFFGRIGALLHISSSWNILSEYPGSTLPYFEDNGLSLIVIAPQD